MKRLLAILCIFAMLATLLPAAVYAENSTESVDFAVFSTTDMHGKCWDKNVLTDGNESNNMLRVATAIKGFRETYGENMLVVDNGDAYQGTPVSVVQLNKITTGESDLPAAMALCFAEIGYDAAVLGNHEFNYPWATMSGIYAYLESRGVQTVTANLYYDGSDGVHEAGENVFTPYITRTVTLNGHEHKIGLLGFENTDCTRWDIPENYPGILFAHPDNPQRSMAWEAQRYIPQMQAEGCEFIIVSYHSGTGPVTGTLTFGLNTEGQVSRMIAECEGIDMVIAGHDHSSAYSNTYLNDKNGDKVLVVNGGGKDLTKSVFTFTEDGEGKLVSAVKETKNLSLGSFASDADLKAKIQPYADMATEYVNQPAGTAVGTWDTSSNYYLQQTNTMDLINCAQMDYGSKYMAKKYDTDEKKAALYEATGLDHTDVDMSSTSAVTNNNYYVRPGEITMKTIVQMYKYDNNVLYLLALTGQQIKDILEQNASTRLKAIVKNGKVTYSTIGEDFTNPVFGGLNFVYDMYQPEGSRVVIEGFSNGRAFELDKTYVVACNSYHLGNAGCGFGKYSTDDSVWNQNDDLAGGNVQEVLFDYISEKGEITTAPFTWHWKLDYTGNLDTPTTLRGDLVAQKTDAEGFTVGDRIVIYYDAEATVIGQDPAENDSRLSAVDTTSYQDFIAFSDKAAVFEVYGHYDEEHPDSFLLTSDKGVLTAGETGNSLGFTETATDCSAWYLVPAEGGYHIMNVGAAFNGNHNQALEWYTGFTTYGVKDTPAYLFNIYKLVDAAKLTEELKDGGRYVVYFDQDELTVGTEANSGGLASTKNVVSGDFLLPPIAEGTLIVTAHINGEGQIDFTSEDGKHLTSNLAGNGLQLTDELDPDGCSLWTLVAVDGGWHVMNVGANYNGNHNQALEFYNGKFTTYGVKDTGAYLFNFFELPGENETPPADIGKVALIADVGGIEDGGFNQQVHEAAKAWCEANGSEYAWYVQGGDYQNFDSGDGAALAAQAIADGAKIILVPGFMNAQAVASTAEANPDVTYLFFDVNQYDLMPEDAGDDWTLPANVYCATYKEEQAGFLAGFAAVCMGYKTLGFLGGPELPGITRFGYGFVLGVDSAAEALDIQDEVQVRFVYTGQFAPNDEMVEFVDGWYKDGVEVVFACGGGIWAAAAEAAKNNNGKLIGVDADQKEMLDEIAGEGATITSAIKDLGATTTLQLGALLDGSFAGGREERLGIVSAIPEENPVRLADSTVYSGEFTEEIYSRLLKRIASGEIEITDSIEHVPMVGTYVRYQCYTACDYDEANYVWEEDNSLVTAIIMCNVNHIHFQAEQVVPTYEVVGEPSCLGLGQGVYTATFTNPLFTTQTKTVDIPALGHDWGEPTYEWAEDLSSVTATRVCTRDESHVETETVATTSEVALEPSCEKAGERVYTATFENEAFQTQTASEPIPALDHEWGEPTYEWAEDLSSVTAKRVCTRDESHVETETAASTCEVTLEPTFFTEGECVYTATFENPAFETQTRTEVLAKAIPENPFQDVGETQYYYLPVLWAVSQKITTGTSETAFSPEDACTRAQVVTFLWRAAGSPEPTITSNPFKDVKSGAYYYKAVLWAVERCVTNGTTATTFSPEDTCTRAQIVTFLWRAEGIPAVENETNPFKDVKPDNYFYKPVLWAAENGITTGTDKTHFSPNDTCTRAQVVTFLYRTAQLIKPDMQFSEKPTENELRLFELLNSYRAQKSLKPLTFDMKLYQCAKKRAAELTVKRATDRPDGQRWYHVLEEFGIRYKHCGQVWIIEPRPTLTPESCQEVFQDSPSATDTMSYEGFVKGAVCMLYYNGQVYVTEILTD